jgi:hypothetical protein
MIQEENCVCMDDAARGDSKKNGVKWSGCFMGVRLGLAILGS